MHEEKILDGKMLATEVLAKVELDVLNLKKGGVFPKLVVILVGENARSEVYIRQKVKSATAVGIDCEVRRIAENVTTEEMLRLIEKINLDDKIHGVIVQVPLPAQLNQDLIFEALSTRKDVDGFSPLNFGKMAKNSGNYFVPCTPLGILKFLEKYEIDVAGKDVVIVGKSNIAGKPMALLLAEKGATVTLCHSQTKDLKSYTQRAEILVVAVGRPRFITEEMVQKGVIVFDIGINDLGDGTICGDVDFENVILKASRITPVPGGCGRMTVASLMNNVIQACKWISM